LAKSKAFFQEKSGGKTIVNIKKVGPTAIGGVFLLAFVIKLLSPKETRTFYKQTSGPSEFVEEKREPLVAQAMKDLFAAGRRQVDANKKKEAEQKRKRIAIKYWAPQIVGDDENAQNVMRSGSKLIGFLKNPIDTRAQTLVRVLIPHGGESGGIEIEPGSILVGNYSYSGDGDRIYLTFSRIDPPDRGQPKKISAAALDAGNFSPGIQGEEFTNSGGKVATSIGLNMLSGMTDTLTDRESLGNSFNGVQAKPSMKNALLQGMSKASQDQASRVGSSIEQERNYVIVPEGKEMIIELQEDYK
jgi:Bacterial conjugation TrbI-like protein